MKSIVLLVDDDPIDIKAMEWLLKSWSCDVITARNGHDALEALQTSPVDLVVSDVRMPGMSGVELANTVSRSHPDLPMVLVTAHGDIRSAVEAMKLGAFDYVIKPPDPDEFKLTITRAMEHSRLRKQNVHLLAELENGGIYGDRLLGHSAAMTGVFSLIDRVARTDSTILISGETGTGKELVARMIHYRSARAENSLIALNCAALNPNLIESELFGHIKGAFTGAVSNRRGKFEEADGGTLFLDEISEISLESQAKLLRVLQEGDIEKIGGSGTVHVDVRVMASTNRDLEEQVKAGRFRQDLYYRLKVIPIRLPPLRERRDDIGLLATHFAALYGRRYKTGPVNISKHGIDLLTRQEWKGNVRELQHTVERAVVLSTAMELTPADFDPDPTQELPSSQNGTLAACLDSRTKEYLSEVLTQTGGHKQNAADRLGIDRATLYRLLKKYGMSV